MIEDLTVVPIPVLHDRGSVLLSRAPVPCRQFMVIGNSINSDTGSVSGQVCGILSGSENYVCGPSESPLFESRLTLGSEQRFRVSNCDQTVIDFVAMIPKHRGDPIEKDGADQL